MNQVLVARVLVDHPQIADHGHQFTSEAQSGADDHRDEALFK